MFRLPALTFSFLLAACSTQVDGGAKVSSTDSALSGCDGTASSSVPADDTYYLTSFGAGGWETMSCGESTKGGGWYYMASRQRFGCGAHVQIEANGKCVVAEADDYGPDVCVENAAGMPIIDASPLVAKKLFDVKSAGWSDRLEVIATVVDGSTPLGPCSASSTGSASSSGGATNVTCYSDTLRTTIPGGDCVQSSADNQWYQCTSQGWVGLYADGTGPLGACAATFPL